MEVQLFNIQTNLRALKRRVWVPVEGKLISDVNKVYFLHYNERKERKLILSNFSKGWDRLEVAEHGRELALREALQKCVFSYFLKG